jgi:hypothetical protein
MAKFTLKAFENEDRFYFEFETKRFTVDEATEIGAQMLFEKIAEAFAEIGINLLKHELRDLH